MNEERQPAPARPRRRYVPAVGPRLTWLLWIVFGLFALLGVNSVYLVSIRVLEATSGQVYQNYFFQWMFLGHLALGALFVVPFLAFGILHIRNAYDRPNRRAVRVGYGLFAVGLVLLASGIVLTRLEGFEVKDPRARSAAYWAHVVCPLLAIWLFVLHRLAGKPIRWRIGAAWSGVAAAVALAAALLHSQDPRAWNQVGPESGQRYFFPSLARTSSGNFIPADTMMMDAYCQECHADVHEQWSHSVHKLSSFNNPVYLFSVRNTRAAMLERDGDVQGSRFCAGCHDPVPFFSGAFDDPEFDDVNHPTSQAGITCTSCHAITHVNSPRGNSDFTIEEPIHYPFAFSDHPALKWINRQLVKAKPEFHKQTFLKPLHKSPEFCGSCHKVHIPEELNDYKWLRGQNHYDTYHLSGVSGHGAQSFYYPEKAVHDCNTCHMQPLPSDDFGARFLDDSGELKVHDHLFPSANPAIPVLTGSPPEIVERHQAFNEGVMRIDVFGIREGGAIDGPLVAPLRPSVPALEPGKSYLLEVVVRTVKMGHHFTQGTTDSNEAWVELRAESDAGVVGQSGALDSDGSVDPWSHFLNSYVLNRDGGRILRREVEQIFVPLYSHQIPPGAGEVVHYRLDVPSDARGTLSVAARLRYRKFDTRLMRSVLEDPDWKNDLPILELAQDVVEFPIAAAGESRIAAAPEFPEWQRWNDYGIGLLRKDTGGANRGQLRQAEYAFAQVEALGRPDGPLNLARVFLREGRLEEAVDALGRAASFEPPAPTWSVAWFTGLVDLQNGYLDEAIASFRSLVELDTPETRAREFDFSQDYRLLNALGQALFERSKEERGDSGRVRREELLREAAGWFERTLTLEPEDLTAHYNLALIQEQLGNADLAAHHHAQHRKYKPDDNARDRAVALARSADPAANHAAEAVVIYDLHRTEAEADVEPTGGPR